VFEAFLLLEQELEAGTFVEACLKAQEMHLFQCCKKQLEQQLGLSSRLKRLMSVFLCNYTWLSYGSYLVTNFGLKCPFLCTLQKLGAILLYKSVLIRHFIVLEVEFYQARIPMSVSFLSKNAKPFTSPMNYSSLGDCMSFNMEYYL
jgi:hypothetical protein